MIKRPLIIFLHWLALSLIIACLWLNAHFGKLSFEQILYFMQFGTDGIIDADHHIFYSFFAWSILLPIVLTVVTIALIRSLQQKTKLILLTGCFAVAITYFIYTIAIVEYITNNSDQDYIAKYYREPNNIKLTAKAKNLILIYVESLENTYSNQNIFGEDLLSNLTQIPAVSFSKFRQIDGANWTIASMVSTMCGIPLKGVYTYGTGLHVNDFGSDQREFLPNINCLGDILQSHGYKNIYMGGAGLAFGAKGKFLRDHGYQEILGKDEFAQLGVTEFSKWGIYDQELLQQAKLKVAALEKQGQPYNLTLLTLDTHTPYGYLSPHCKARGHSNYKGIVKCTAESLQDFVAYLSEHDYLKNTQIVILGDHLVMSGQVLAENLNQNGERMVYNKFIVSGDLIKNRDEMVHLDMFPTILQILGFTITDNRLGLGVAGFGQTTIETADYHAMHNKLMGASAKYYSFWKPLTTNNK